MAKLPVLVDKNNVRDFIDSFDAFMTDCDGVLWMADTVIDRADEVLNKLRTLGKKIFFVTNNSTKSRDQYVEKCIKLGFKVDKREIIGSAYVLALYLQLQKHQGHFNGRVYVIGSEGVAKELDEVGIPHFGVGPDPLVFPNTYDLIKTVTLEEDVGAVVVAFDGHISFPKILKAASYINSDPKCLFLATNTDECFPVPDSNLTFPGTGAMVRAVECVVGREALVMGKPEPRMFELIRGQHNLNPSRTIMVGDRCNTDIRLGNNCGLHTLLVLTGVHSLDDVSQWLGAKDECLRKNVPGFYLPSLGALLPLLQGL